MTRDRIYRSPKKPVPPFAFNAAVVRVFDDMIHRSVPLYAEIIRRQAQMIAEAYRTGTRIYDLGCSTGNLALALCDLLPTGRLKVVAVDNSRPMLDELVRRLAAKGRSAEVRPLCSDIRTADLKPASVVVVNFSLQFVPREDRDALIQRIYDVLLPGGMLLVSEKTVHPDAELSRLEVDFYHRFKRENGYSEMEISQKREALENVLVPETVAAHQERLQRCGFGTVDIWLKWFNFCAWVCIK